MRLSRRSAICDQIQRWEFERSLPRGSEPGEKGPWRPQNAQAPSFGRENLIFYRIDAKRSGVAPPGAQPSVLYRIDFPLRFSNIISELFKNRLSN